METERQIFQRAIEGVYFQMTQKMDHDPHDPSWNPDAHVEITVTVADCRKVADLMAGYEPPPPAIGTNEVRRLRKALEEICTLTARGEHDDDCDCGCCLAWNLADAELKRPSL